MNHLIVQLLCLLSFGWLALAINRHQETVFGQILPSRTTLVLRLAGWAGFACALLAAIRSHGVPLGLVSYSGHTSLSAGLIFAALVACRRRSASRH